MKLFISSNNSSKFWRILIIYFFSKTLSGSQTTTPDTLRFLIPGMCHLVAEDKPRKIILEMKMHETLFTYLSYHWTIFDSHKHWLKEQVREIHVRRQMSESWDIFMIWKINSGLVWAVGQYCEKKFGADYERSFFYNFYSQFLKFCSNLGGIVYLPSDCLNRYQGICSIFFTGTFFKKSRNLQK